MYKISRLKSNSFIRFIFLLIIISGLFYACSPEKKIAKDFVYKGGKRYALVIPPDYIFKYNRKEWLLDSIKENLTPDQQDSVLWELSSLIKDINDSIYIIKFIRGYNYKLAEFGFDVFSPEYTDLFMEKDSNAYVVNIPQIEMEETIYPYKDKTVINGYTYFHQHYLNALDVSMWFEISKVNDTAESKVLFANNLLTDDLESSFEYDDLTDQVKYFYQIDTLSVDDVYKLAVLLGKRYAQYTFDYLMNKYILEHKKEGDTLMYYWHYDVNKDKFYQIWEEENKFIPVE